MLEDPAEALLAFPEVMFRPQSPAYVAGDPGEARTEEQADQNAGRGPAYGGGLQVKTYGDT